jgi:hypothetical protein
MWTADAAEGGPAASAAIYMATKGALANMRVRFPFMRAPLSLTALAVGSVLLVRKDTCAEMMILSGARETIAVHETASKEPSR